MLRVTPVPVARALAAAGGTLAWAVQGDRRRILLQNLEFTASERSPAERRQLARRTFRNLAVTAVDQFRLPIIAPAEVRSLFEIRGLEHVEAAQARGKGTVIATAHLGPYELAAACFAATGYSVYGMVEDLDPAVLDALATYRSATGMQLVNMKDGLRAAYRILGEGHILALVADRAIGDTRGLMEVPFAGGRRLLPTGPVVFAQATGAALVTAFARPNPRGEPRYVMEFDAPLIAESRDAGERDRLMMLVAQRMGAAVQRNPDQWFVFQPNWITRDRA